MYTVPQWFADRLARDFDNRFRVRWSNRAQKFQVEYRVDRGFGEALEPPADNNGDYDRLSDDYLRARDGYDLLFSVCSGDRMPCPQCGLTLRVPVMAVRETVCEHCKFHDKDGRYLAVYFPLGEALLEHLRLIDPLTGGPDRVLSEVRRSKIRREATIQRDFYNGSEAYLDDKFNRLFDIPQVGYTGKEQ